MNYNNEIITKLAINISTILLNAMKNAVSSDPKSPDVYPETQEDAVDEVMQQLTEHLMVELTKALLDRAKRVSVEEAPSSTATDTVKKLGVKVTDRMNRGMDDSSTDLSQKIKDSRIIVGQMKVWGTKHWSGSKKSEFNSFLTQLDNMLN